MIDVDIHIELFLSSDDRWIDQGYAGDLVPHVAGKGILFEVLGDGRIRFQIVAFISFVKCVFTEMSIGVIVIFFQGARSTMWAASGSNHQLNSRRASIAPVSMAPLSAYSPPPMRTNSFASVATDGSSLRAKA